METPQRRYVTTTLPYVNSDPHIGFASEIILADALARYWRLLGHEVFFNTGTDEHGQKIAQKADEKGESRQAYVDHYAGEFAKLKDELNLSYDNFIRTTEQHHKKAAQELWRRCEAKGDIYKKKYKGLYCVGCELFYKESELEEGTVCSIHKTPVQEIEEENYFFKLSNYQDTLLAYLADDTVITPSWRRDEAISFVESGLEDFSISREKSRMDWGVEVPGDATQVMYVWFDALTNYISTLGWPEDKDGNFKKFWEEGQTLQVAGKDQVRFQSVMWQAMLISAELPTTKKVLYHGFINSGGQKMSKSLGNVIAPSELVAKYGTDATRYLLLRHVHPFEDTDITWERLDEWYTANLVNGLGNLTSRIMQMSETYGVQTNLLVENKNFVDSGIINDINSFRFQNALDVVFLRIKVADETITKREPFKVFKSNPLEARDIVKSLTVRLNEIAIYLRPFMPETASIILDAIKENKKPENLFKRLES